MDVRLPPSRFALRCSPVRLLAEIPGARTERFLGLQTHTDGHVVHVRPEQVVEIAYDGVQRSTRYPGGIALRFARVLGYREDKGPEEVDTLDSLRAGL